MTIASVADITGAGAAVPLVAASGGNVQARRIWIYASGSGVRFGDIANVGSARGVEIPATTLVTFSASDADGTDQIPLDQAAVYVPSMVTVTVSFGN